MIKYLKKNLYGLLILFPYLIHAASSSQLGTINLLGQIIDIEIPTNYLATANIENLYQEALKNIQIGQSYEWKVKVFIFNQSDILEKSQDNIFRQRRSRFESEQTKKILEALGQFKALAETKSNGKINITFSITQDKAPLRWILDSSKQVIDSSFIEKTFAPHINQNEFEANDNIYRGPFHSVFFIHPTLTSSNETQMLNQTPVSGIAFYTDSEIELKNGLAFSFYNKWIEHLNLQAINKGYRIPFKKPISSSLNYLSNPQVLIRPEMWSVITNLKTDTDKDYILRHWSKPELTTYLWNDVKDNPWVKLPRLPINKLPQQDSTEALLFSNFSEAKKTLFIESQYVDQVWDEILSKTNTQCLGFIKTKTQLYIVFEGDNIDSIEIEKLIALQQPHKIERPLDNGFLIKEEKPENIIEIKEEGTYRYGQIILLDQQQLKEKGLENISKISFEYQTNVKDPYALYFESKDGQFHEWIQLGTPWPNPIELKEFKSAFQTVLAPKEGEWQKVIVDLSKTSLNQKEIGKIIFAPTIQSRYYERQQIKNCVTLFKNFAAEQTSQEVTDQINVKFMFADQLKEIALLSDISSFNNENSLFLIDSLKGNNELIRLNAVALAAQIKVPEEALPALINQSYSANPFIAEMAMKAFTYQNTSNCIDAILGRAYDGPFDHNRQAAVKQIDLILDSDINQEAKLYLLKNPKLPDIVSFAMTSTNWHTRDASINALSKIKSFRNALMMMSYLFEEDPIVRTHVIEQLDPSLELVNRRLMWYAINDSCEIVRTKSYYKLLQSPLEEYKKEGHKGIRDESKEVRLNLIRQFAKNPNESYRNLLRIAVLDLDAKIRAEALKTFALLPEKVEIEEIETTLLDQDPRVQIALIKLSKAKNISLPQQCRAQLKQSVSQKVRQQVQEI